MNANACAGLDAPVPVGLPAVSVPKGYEDR